MGLSDSIEKFTEVKSEFDPITKPLDDNDHNNFSKDAVIINETTGNTIHQINSFRQPTTEQVPSYDLQLSFPQVEETFKFVQLQQSGQYLGNADVNVMQAANRQETAIQQRMFQNQRQEGINYLVSPDYQMIKMTTDQSNIAHSPNYVQAIREGVVQQEDDLIDLPYQINNVSKITPYHKVGDCFSNLNGEQQNFVNLYLDSVKTMKEKEMMKKSPLYKSLPFSAKYKLDCLAKKQQKWKFFK